MRRPSITLALALGLGIGGALHPVVTVAAPVLAPAVAPKIVPKVPSKLPPVLPTPAPKPKPKPAPTVKAVTAVSASVPAIVPPFRGHTACRAGDPDCNRCLEDVRGQFRRIKEGQRTRKRKPWRFEWGKSYGPDATKPFDAFDEDSPLADGASLSHAHPQGFVRTNSSRLMYAGSHSQYEHSKPGTIFVVRQRADGKKFLAYLHRTKSRHPSGVHVLGKFLVFGERDGGRDLLRVIDIDRAHVRQDIAHRMPTSDEKLFGGGIGIARLAAGGWLLVATQPGDRDAERRRYHNFYKVTGNLERPADLRIELLREQTYVNPARFGGKERKWSENLSLVTECGTGDIYSIHSSGDGSGVDGLIGGGYWRLSKLVNTAAGPALDPIDVYDVSQNAEDCHMRSAASAGVGPGGKLELLCHQYRKDPDPSAVNPFQFNVGGQDAWNFVAETPS